MIFSQDACSTAQLDAELQDIARRLNLEKLEDALYFPKYFQVETIRVCNAKCPFCAVDQWDKSTPLMPDELFEKIAEEMSDYSDWIEFVSIQRAGEPLLDKKIVPRVKRLKDAGIKHVTMSTNASFLGEDKSRQLLDAGLDEVMMSIDSIDRPSYEKMRVGLDYDQVIANIQNFFKLRNQLNPKVIVRVRGVSFHDLENDESRAELARWTHFWDEIKLPHDRIYMKKPHNWGNQKEWDTVPEYADIFHPCVLPWSTMHVTAMGTVPLCPQDYDGKADLGNVWNQSIAEIWRGEGWDRIRRLHRTGQRNQIDFCRGCRLFDEEFHMENDMPV